MQRTVPPSDPELRVRVAAEQELRDRFGRTGKVNPFLPPASTFRGRTTEFLVLMFEASGPVRLEIVGIARAGKAAAGGVVTGSTGTAGAAGTELLISELPAGSVLGRGELRRFWEVRTVDDGSPDAAAENQRKIAAIDRYTLDLYGMNILNGRSPYVLVLLGPAPGNADHTDLVLRFNVNGKYRELRLGI